MKNFNTDEFLKSLEPLYLEGRFEEAVELLTTHKTQLDAWVYHFNMGTFSSKMEKYGAGRYHLEKSMMYSGDRSLAETNLQFVLDKLGPVDVSLGLTQFESWAIYLQRFPQNYSIILGLVLMIIVSLLWNAKLIKRWYTLAFLFVFAILPTAVDHFWVRVYKVAIVLDNTPVHTGPSEIFEEKGELTEGSKLLLKSSSDGQWLQVLKPARSVGWVKNEKIGQL